MTHADDDADAAATPPSVSRPAGAIHGFVAPLAVGLVMAVVTQLSRFDRPATGLRIAPPESFLVTLVVCASALLIGAWWCSRFRLRTAAAAAGLLALWSGFLLAEGPSLWQIAAMVLVLAVAMSLLVPRRTGAGAG